MKPLYMRDRKLYNKLQRQAHNHNMKCLCMPWRYTGYAMIHPTLDKVVIFDTTNGDTITLKEV